MLDNVIKYLDNSKYSHILDILLSVLMLIIYLIGNVGTTIKLIDQRENVNWSNAKFILYIIFQILNWGILFSYLYFRLTRIYNPIWKLFGNAVPTFIIPLVLYIIFTIIISLLGPSTEYKKKTPEEKTTPDNKKPSKDKVISATGKPTEVNIGAIIGYTILGILILVILGGLIWFMFNKLKINKKYLIITIIVIVVLAIVIGVPILVTQLAGKQYTEKSKDKYDKNLDLKYSDPTNRIKTAEELEYILKQLGSFKMDNECKINGQNDCSYLYQEFVHSKGDPKTLNNMLEQLNKMDKSKTGLINQAIFLIYQLLQCKLEVIDKTTFRRFGTLDWWRKNILMSAGNDPIQQYIYAISALTCLLFLLYNLYTYLYHAETIYNGFTGWTIYGLIATIVYIITLTSSYFSFSSGGTYEEPNKLDKDLTKYQQDKADALTTGGKWGWGLLGSNIGLLIISIIASFVGGTEIGEWGKVNATAILLAFIISFNVYYMTIIPQLMIIGLILQKYILQTPLPNDILPTIIKAFIIIGVLIASFYDTTYKNKDTKLEKNVTTSYNKPVWYIFGILIFLLLQNGIESMTGLTDEYNNNNWSLILIPAIRYVMELVSRHSIDYNALSIQI